MISPTVTAGSTECAKMTEPASVTLAGPEKNAIKKLAIAVNTATVIIGSASAIMAGREISVSIKNAIESAYMEENATKGNAIALQATPENTAKKRLA